MFKDVSFIPDDYVRNRESRRDNIMYLVLLLVVMAGLGSVFGALKVREHRINIMSAQIDAKMNEAHEAIHQLEDMQTKRAKMMQTALMTAELIEPVPRSVLVAAITNELPLGVSLNQIKLTRKKIITPRAPKTNTSKYKTAQQANAQNTKPDKPLSEEKMYQTKIEIGGIAPSDIQVANYIANLSGSILLDEVGLVLSEQCEIDDQIFREFKLNAVLKKNIYLTKEDIATIRSSRQNF